MDPFTAAYAREKSIPMPNEDPVGIQAYAAEMGIPADVVFALATSVLAGVAGPYFLINTPMAGPVSPGLNLAVRQGDFVIELVMREMIDVLSTNQKILRERSNEHTVESLYRARYEGFKPRNADDLQQVNDHLAVGGVSSREPKEQLALDLARVKESVRMEALLHPTFLLGGTLGANTVPRLMECHSGHGYYCGNPGSLPRSPSLRNKEVDQLLRFLLGTTAMSGHSKYQTPLDCRELVLSGLFVFSEQDLRYLVEKRRDLLGNMLLVSSGTGIQPSADEDPESRYCQSYEFLRRFHKAARHCLALRRAGLGRVQGFTDENARLEFTRQQREFLRELSQSPHSELALQAARLPAMLAWMISFLEPGNGHDDYILATAVPTARKLTEANLQPYLIADNQTLIERRRRMAGKLHARLVQLQPCKARTLSRGLDQQKMDLIYPVLDALIVHGIVDQAPDKTLRVGQVPLSRLDVHKLLPPAIMP